MKDRLTANHYKCVCGWKGNDSEYLIMTDLNSWCHYVCPVCLKVLKK